MDTSRPRCNRSLSQRGAAWGRLAVVAAVLVLAVVLVARGCRSREERLWDFVDATRQALLAGRRAEVLAAFDPAVRYQRDGGLAAIERDYAAFRASGIRTVQVTSRSATFEADRAQVRVEAVVLAGLRPLASVIVEFDAVERDGGWRVTELTWK